MACSPIEPGFLYVAEATYSLFVAGIGARAAFRFAGPSKAQARSSIILSNQCYLCLLLSLRLLTLRRNCSYPPSPLPTTTTTAATTASTADAAAAAAPLLLVAATTRLLPLSLSPPNYYYHFCCCCCCCCCCNCYCYCYCCYCY